MHYTAAADASSAAATSEAINAAAAASPSVEGRSPATGVTIVLLYGFLHRDNKLLQPLLLLPLLLLVPPRDGRRGDGGGRDCRRCGRGGVVIIIVINEIIPWSRRRCARRMVRPRFHRQ